MKDCSANILSEKHCLKKLFSAGYRPEMLALHSVNVLCAQKNKKSENIIASLEP